MRIIIILLACTFMLLLGYSAYRGYELWKQGHWMTMAKAYADRNDPNDEILCLKQVLLLNPRNVDACRMMAILTEAQQSRSSLTFREQVLQLNPNSLDDRLALARTALVFHDIITASNALAGVDDAGRKTADYFNVAGEYAVACNQPGTAQSDFAEASRLDPSNFVPQFNLATIELRGSNVLDMAEARITLSRISMNSTNIILRNEADRQLIGDAMRFRDDNTALSYSSHLVQQTNASFPDKLLRLSVLKLTGSDGYDPALASTESEATDTDTRADMMLWMIRQNLSAQALAWERTLPASVQTNVPTEILATQCQMLLQDWNGVQKSISKQNWGNLEYTRHAYIARAMRMQGLGAASKAEWDVAVKSATQSSDLNALFGFASQWGWQEEAQQMLWDIVNAVPQEQWAGEVLAVSLLQNGDTRPLMQLFSIQANRNPADLGIKNNLALTAMLLGEQELNPYDIARDIYQKEPTNSFFACTYALSLHLQGKNADALKVMRQLTPQELEDSERAGYYGVILKAVGDNANASIYLKRSLKGKLLPEERAMFEKAESGL